jgi:hypothetical protein
LDAAGRDPVAKFFCSRVGERRVYVGKSPTTEPAVNHVLVPIALFVCVAYVFKVLIDGCIRWMMFKRGGSEELVRMIVDSEEQRRRSASLHWGAVLLALAIGLGISAAMGWNELTMGVAATLIGATAVGNLTYWFISRH